MDPHNSAVERMNQLGRERKPFLFIIDFEGINPLIYPLHEIPEGIQFVMPGPGEPGHRRNGTVDGHLHTSPVPYPMYRKAFDKVMGHLLRGNSYLVNLTLPTPVTSDLSLEEIFHQCDAPYRLLVPEQFVLFSPEPFIRIDSDRIRSFPMKGTIDASLPDAADRVLADVKEAAEHVTIVDLIRNDLSRVATDVEVVRYRYLEQVRSHDRDLLQVSSEIRGILPENWQDTIGNLLFALLPAGSVSGAPKAKTLEIIREAEGEPRGYYTGVFGVFNGTSLDSSVMIRFIEQTGTGLRYRSGGGITHLSQAANEYDELLQKIYLPITHE